MNKLLFTFCFMVACSIAINAQVLYGTTALNHGTISKYDAATNSLTAAFRFEVNGAYPTGSLVQGTDVVIIKLVKQSD